MSRYLRDIATGSLRDVRNLRKGDELVDFYDTFQRMLTCLQDREKRDIAALEQTIGALRDELQKHPDVADELGRAVDTLAEMKKRKQEALG